MILKLSKLTALLSAFENVVYFPLFLNGFSRTHSVSFFEGKNETPQRVSQHGSLTLRSFDNHLVTSLGP